MKSMHRFCCCLLLWALSMAVPLYADQVAKPSFVPSGGTSPVRIPLIVTCNSANAVIHYTTTGVDPTVDDPTVENGGQILVSRSSTLKAKAWDGSPSPALTASDVASTDLWVVGDVFAGEEVGFALRFDSGLLGWGRNDDGRLGDGSLVSPTAPESLGPNFLKLAAGSENASGQSHTIFLKVDGTVWASGTNAMGELGNNSNVTPTDHRPVQVEVQTGGFLTNVIDIAAGRQTSFALSADGYVYAWGENGAVSKLGDGTTLSRAYADTVKIAASTPLTNIVQIVAKGDHALALRSDGTVWAWGDNSVGELGNGSAVASTYAVPVLAGATGGDPDAPLTGAISLAAGDQHSIAILGNGNVAGWGEAAAGRLGDGTSGTTSSPRLRPILVTSGGSIPLTGIAQGAAGTAFSLLLRQDGSIVAFGQNTSGQLGDGSITSRSFPVQVLMSGSAPLQDVVAVSAAGDHALALSSSGVVYSWGGEAFGQLGNGIVAAGGTSAFATAPTTLPVLINSAPAVSLAPLLNTVFQPGSFTLSATASDVDGNLAGVHFLQNGVILGTVLAPPWQWTVSNLPAGGYNFQASAFDSAGAATLSNVVNGTVTLPVISVTASSTTLLPATPVTLTFSVGDGPAPVSDLQVSYTVTGTAVSGVDYLPLAGNVTIGSGQRTASVTVSVPAGVSARPSSTMVVTVSTQAGQYLLGSAASTIIIIPGSPGAVGGLRLWLTASSLTNPAVSSWPDQSGRGNSAVQVSASSQPQLVTSSVNGRAAVHFQGSVLSLPTDFLNGATAAEMFIVHRSALNQSAGSYVGFHKLGASPYSSHYPYFGVIYDEFCSTVRKTTGTPAQPLDQFHIYNVVSGPGEWTSRINGQVVYTTNDNAFAVPNSPRLGEDGYSFTGDVAEILIYDHTLSPSDRANVTQYLNAEYALITPPAAPSLAANAVSGSQISLGWTADANYGAETFILERRAGNDAYQQIATFTGTSGFLDSGLIPGSTYTYRMRATGLGGQSPNSADVTATTSQDPDLPMTGVRLWVNAGSLAGSNVAVWPDLSGNGNMPVQAVATAQPVLSLNALNGRPVVHFDGFSNCLNVPPNFLNGATAAEMLTVHRSALNRSANSYTGFHRFGSSYYGACYPFYGSIYDTFFSTAQHNIGAPTQPLDQYHLYDAVSQNGAWTCRFNGTTFYTTAGNTFGAASAPQIGTGFNGDVAELVIFDHVLTSAELTSWNVYLNRKYTLVPAPAPPANVTANAVPGRVAIRWDPSSGASSYRVERKANGADFETIGGTDATPGFLDSSVTPGAVYTYRVYASALGEESTPSSEVSTAASGEEIFIPTDSLLLWLRADSGATTDALGKLSTLLDLSGTGHNAGQSITANRPAIAVGDNSATTMRFDGSSSYLTIPEAMSGFQQGITVFVVAKPTSTASYARLFDFGNGPGVNNVLLARYGADNSLLWGCFGPQSTVLLSAAAAYTLNKTALFSATQDANSAAVYRNGTLVATAASTSPSSATLLSNFIGKSNWPSDPLFQGDINEIIVYNRVLTSAELFSVHDYLDSRYSILLPVTPSALTGQPVSGTQISLSWTGGDDAGGCTYLLERKSGSGTYAQVAAISGRTSYLDATAVPSTAYTYRVRASATAGVSGYSAEASVTTSAAPSLALDGLRLWLSASSLPTGPVSLWSDLSGNGVNAVQANAWNQPSVVPNQLMGLPVVHFESGSNQFLTLPNLMNGATGGEVMAVLRSSVSAGNNGIWYLGGDPWDWYPCSDGSLYNSFGSTVQRSEGVPPHPITSFHIYNVSSAAGLWESRLDGDRLLKSNVNSVTFCSAPCVGRNGSGYAFSGDIAELVIFDHPLSETGRAALMSYLNGKYNVIAAPSVPANVAVEAAGVNENIVTWTAPTVNELVQYTVERATSSGGPFVGIGAVNGTGAFIDTTAVAGQEYFYRVIAQGVGGSSNPSDPIAVSTLQAGAGIPVDGMMLWLTGRGLTQNPVAQWLDFSGNGNDAVQSATASQPTLLVNALNGQAAVHFDGSFVRSLYLPDLLHGASAGEILVVLRANATTNAYSGGAWTFGTGGLSFYRTQSVGELSDDFGSSTGQYEGQPAQDVSQFHVYEACSEPNLWQSWIDGVPLARNSANSVAFTSSPQLGANAYNYAFAGDIAEVVVYNRALSPAERQGALSYLARKFALQTTPAAPTQVRANMLHSDSALITWVSPETNASMSYKLWRRKNNEDWQCLDTVPNVRTYIDSGLEFQSRYQYRVQTVALGGISDYSASAKLNRRLEMAEAFPVDGMKLWLMADGVPEGVVNYWPDVSGNGNDAWQTRAADRPSLINNALNGMPVVHFPGPPAHGLNLPDIFQGSSAGEILVVIRENTAAATDNGLWNFGGNGYSFYPAADGGIIDDFGSSTVPPEIYPEQNITQFHVYRVSSQSGTWESSLDGRVLSQSENNSVGFSTSPILGSNAYGAGFSGDIAEVIAYDRVLSPTERNTLTQYFAVKYLLPDLDPDGDGLTNAQEALRGTNPLDWDSNRDGLSDSADLALGFNPLNRDVDGDGLSNAIELRLGTNSFKADTDGDGILDGLDAFPLDPTRWQLPVVPGDATAPTITLIEPFGAVLVP